MRQPGKQIDGSRAKTGKRQRDGQGCSFLRGMCVYKRQGRLPLSWHRASSSLSPARSLSLAVPALACFSLFLFILLSFYFGLFCHYCATSSRGWTMDRLSKPFRQRPFTSPSAEVFEPRWGQVCLPWTHAPPQCVRSGSAKPAEGTRGSKHLVWTWVRACMCAPRSI
ncbi:hypothetical protein LZ30DRAFT_96686 [Colletotrichum cereale]|nr:hypothetical protein LZ30DRAFT_96686 [Colletotrichum cereale]